MKTAQKILSGLLLGSIMSFIPIFGFAKVDATPAQQQQLYEIVENSLHHNAFAQAFILDLIQHYSAEDDDIKNPYNPLAVSFSKCLDEQLSQKKYQETLKKGIQHYLASVSPERFKGDFAFISSSAQLAKANSVKNFVKNTAKRTDVEVVDLQTTNDKEIEAFKGLDLDIMLDAMFGSESYKHIRFLLGFYIPNEEDIPLDKANPMAKFNLDLINTCHADYWESLAKSTNTKSLTKN